MYQPSEFQEQDARRLEEHIRAHSFGILVGHGPDGLTATHAPFLFDPATGEHGRLTGHQARRNPQWRGLADGTDVLVIFTGPDAYVSPTCYAAEPDVPTWNYTAVHAHGTYRRITDPTETLDVLRRTVAEHESDRADVWRLDTLDDELVHGLARGVVAFHVDVTALYGGFKLSQDKLQTDVDAVVAGLDATNRPDATMVATTMRDLGVQGRAGSASTDPTAY